MSTDHSSLESGNSQCACILAELQAYPNQWLSLGRLHVASGSMNVHSRISDLRKRGHTILHKNTRKGRMVQSFYQLQPPMPQDLFSTL